MVFARKHALLFASLSGLVFALPIRREVPQEHSHNAIVDATRTALNLNNPDGIVDPIFGLLGNAAAAAGQGKISSTDCLQQATADQAFTNAKAAGDIAGMTAALQFRALERNTGKVGLASVLCTAVKPVNPEIAAITQHQDPASSGAAATNKAIVLELAKQIATIGGDPQAALATGTFKPDNLNDNTGKGNTCDTADDTVGCIISQNLLVEDATPDEIDAAVSGVAAAAGGSDAAATSTVLGVADVAGDAAPTASCSLVAVTVTVTESGTAPTKTSSSSSKTSAAAVASVTSTTAVSGAADGSAVIVASSTAAAASTPATTAAGASPTENASSSGSAAAGINLQVFNGNVGGTPPPVTAGGEGFEVDGSEFATLAAALGRSCDVQHNTCANAANSGGGFSVSSCDTQNDACKAASGPA